MEDKQTSASTEGAAPLTPIGVTPAVASVVSGSPTPHTPRPQLRGFSRTAILAILALLIVLGGLYILLTRSQHATNNSLGNAPQPAGSYDIQNVPASQLSDASTLALSTTQSLSVNGQLRTNGSLILTPSAPPKDAVKGQIYYDSTTNTPYVYDGKNFVSMSVASAVQSIGGQTGAIAVGPGLSLQSGQLGLDANTLSVLNTISSGTVTSIQGKTGAVSFTSGNGISVDGTTITNTGVVAITAASPQVTVTQTGTGAYGVSVNLPGDMTTSTGTVGRIAVFDASDHLVGSLLSQNGTTVSLAGDLGVTGQLQANSISSLTPGQDFNISAGSDQLVFTSGGRTFQLPATGAANQTICTVGMDCTTGGGAAYVLLQPGAAQQDTGSGPSLYINNTGGGNLLQLQGNSLDAFTVDNAGNTTIAGNLTVNGAINGATVNNANINGGTITGANINNASITGGSLTNTTVNGLTVTSTAIASTGALSISATADQNLNLNASGTGMITLGTSMVQGTGAMTLSAGGTDQDLTLTGSGLGNVIVQMPVFHNANGATYRFDTSDPSSTDATICTSVGNCNGSSGVTGGGTVGTIAVWNGTGFSLGDSLIAETTTTVTVSGDFAANNLQGNGAGLTHVNAELLGGQSSSYYLNASNINTGTLGDTQLSANVAKYNDTTANFTGTLQQNGNNVCTTAGNCIGAGGGAVGGSGTGGTIAVWDGTGFSLTDSLITEDATSVTVNGDFSATTLTGSGAGLTGLNATNVATGTLGDARLSANVTLQGNTFNGASQLVKLNSSGQLPALDGGLLTNLNAGNIASGTIADARLTSNVALQNVAANFTGTLQQNGNNVCTTAGNCIGAGGGAVGGSGTGGTIAVWDGTGFSLTDSSISEAAGVVTVAGDLVATNLQGNGSAVTDVNAALLGGHDNSYYQDASNLTAGTLSDARLSANVALLGADNSFSGNNNYTGTLKVNGDDVCTTAGNCVGGSGGALGGGGTAGTVALWTGTGYTLGDSLLSQASGAVVVSGGNITAGGTNQALTLQGNGTGGVTVKVPTFMNANGATYAFDSNDTSATTATICTSTGNCVGSGQPGGAVGGGGTAGTIAVWDGSGFTLADSLLSQSGTTVTVAGDLAATNLQGNGAAVTNVDAAKLDGQVSAYYLNASNINAGTLADARLSVNVTLAGNAFNGNSQLVQLTSTGQLPALDGSQLTNLNAASISSGILDDARLSTNVALLNQSANFTGAALQLGGNDVCTTAGNCVGSGGGISSAGSANYLPIYSTDGYHLANSMLSQNAGGTQVTVSGQLTATNGIAITGNSTVVGTLSGLTGIVSSGTVQLTGLSTVGVVHNAVDGTLSTSLITNSDLQGGTYGAITGTGTLGAGAIGSGFGTITTTNNIGTTATVFAGTINATSTLQTNNVTRLDNVGALTNITGYNQTSGNFNQAGAGTFATGSGAVTLNGAATANSSLAVVGATTLQDTVTVAGSQFTNQGSTLNTALTLGDFATGGSIGAALATVDTHTSIAISQTTAGQTLSLPAPTSTTAGRVVYVFNTGTTGFTMGGITVPNGYGQIFLWNGTSWILGANGGGTSLTLQGAYDGGNTLNTTDARDITFGLANTTTDSNFRINIATGSTSQFKVQSNGTDRVTINSNGRIALLQDGAAGGISIGTLGDTQLYRSGANRLMAANALTIKNTTDTTSAFQVQTTLGSDVLAVDTVNARVVVGEVGTPVGQLYVGGTLPQTTLGGTLGNVPLGTAMAVVGDYVYNSQNNGNSMYITNISDPSNPRDMGTVDIGMTAVSFKAAGRYLYMSGIDGMRVYDLSNPVAPTALGSIFDLGNVEASKYLKITGNYAYTIGSDATNTYLRVVDISDPAHLKLTSSTKIGPVSESWGNNIAGLEVAGHYLYTGYNTTNGNAFEVYDISSPAHPLLAGSIAAATNSASGLYSLSALTIAGSYAYAIDDDGHGWTVDISDPTNPTVTGGSYDDVTYSSDIYQALVQGNRLYVSDYNGSILAYDITNRGNPTYLGTIVGACGNRFAITITGRYLYSSCYWASPYGLSITDLGGIYAQSAEVGSFQSTSVTTTGDVSVGGSIAIQGGINADSLNVQDSASVSGGLKVAGDILQRTSTDSTTAFQVQNNSGATVLGADTVNGRVGIGTATPSAILEVVGAASADILRVGVSDDDTTTLIRAKSNGDVTLGTSGAAATTVGTTTVGSTTDSGINGLIIAKKVTTGSSAVNALSASIATGPVDSAPYNSYQLGIYADNAGAPGAWIASSSVGTLTANAWNTMAISAALAPNTTYWIVYTTNSGNANLDNEKFDPAGAPGSHAYTNFTFGSGTQSGLPATWPAGGGSGAVTTSMYISGNTIGGALSVYASGAVGIGTSSPTSSLFTLKTQSNSTAFDIQNSSGASLFGADTSTMSVTVGGSIAYQHGTDYSVTGTTNNVNFGIGALFRLTGASAQTITGIAGGVNGRIITLVNAAAQAATLGNNSASSTAANRIITGTGSDFSLAAGASAELVYDNVDSVWRVVGAVAGSVGGGSYVTLQGTTPGAADTGNFNISGKGMAGTLQASTVVVTPSLDTASATALTVGGTNASGITIGHSGIVNTITGLNNTLNSAGTSSITAGGSLNLTAAGSSTLTTSAGDLTVGTSSTSGVLRLQATGATGSILIGDFTTPTISIGSGSNSTRTINIASGNTSTSATVNLGSNGTVNIGSTGSAATTNTTNINTTSSATGTQIVNLGSSANAANALTLEAGNTGQIKIGDGATAHTVRIATGAAAQTVTIGSTNTTSTLNLQAGTGSINLLTNTNITGTLTVSAAATFQGSITINGHIVSGGTAPTIIAGTICTTVGTVALTGTDVSGSISTTLGSSCSSTGGLVHVAFATSYTSAPSITLTPSNALAGAMTVYVKNVTTTGFDIATSVNVSAGNQLSWYYHVIQ